MLELYERGLYLQAYQATLPWGPVTTWRGTRATILGGRLASNLGGARLSNWLMRQAWRRDPDDADARYYYAYTLWRLRGPYFAGQWIARRPNLPNEASPDTRSSWLALRGGIAGLLRDFDVAENWLRKAEELTPDSPWVQVCWSGLWELEDRYEESLAAAQRALQLRPWFRPAIQAASHVLTLMDRDQEALQLLSEAAEHVESNATAAQRFQLQLELKLFAEARQSLERCAALSPLADKQTKQWLAAQRSEIAYRLGDLDATIRYAIESDNEFCKTVAARLQEPARASAAVSLLPVGFVRQHHLTCVPATLAAISRFWSMPADHLQVADEICYNGTTAYSERKWALDHGWWAREFTVTEPVTAALIGQGIPFTLTTIEPGSAHLQAVIGYDGRRGTLIIRDPYWRNANEGLADKVLARYAAYGPRGMALIPVAERAKLDALDLPDAAGWDQLHALDAALVAHRRNAAQQIFQELQAEFPDHRLTREARRRLATYDQNPTEQLAAAEGLLEFNPEDQSLQLERLACLRELARREQRLEIYQQVCSKKETHPIFWQQYAQELRIDARRHPDAIWLLRRAIRRWPTEGLSYYILANIYWDQRQFDEALELYRIAACLDDKDERLAHAYFTAAICRKQTDRALQFLRQRFERFGRKSSLPARTLYAAYSQLNRAGEALAVLDAALALRPDDGELLLYAADSYVSCSSGNLARGQALLQQARDKSPPGAWLRTAARMASLEGLAAEALEAWRRVLELQPLAIDAHRALTRALAETQGPAAALAHLEQTSARFPHYHPIHELWIEWLRDEPPETRDPVIRKVIAENPDDAWMRREWALWQADQGRFSEAWEQLELARQIDPLNPSYHMVRAHLLRRQEHLEEARQALRQAIELSVDNDLAIGDLIDLCETLEQRREALAFVKDQLIQQIIFGDGLLAFRTYAREALAAEEVLALLRDAWQSRPDLWHAWSAMICQLLDANQVEEAGQLAAQATERFPLVPRLWLDRASVCRAAGEGDGELAALQTAYEINPDWNTTVYRLCDLHDRRGQYDRSRELLERIVARNPLDAVSQLRLAEAQWRAGAREAALEQAAAAVQREPGYDYAWDCLNRWADELKCPERALQAARELTERRGGEARSWLMLAKLLDAQTEIDERLAALQRAITSSPRCLDAYDLQAVTLAGAERWDEALAACHPAAWNQHPPSLLRARAAWIEAQQGKLPAAIQRMEALVADEPYYYEAWSQLADWYLQAEEAAKAVEAAEALVRLRPHSEISYGYLGDALQFNNDREGARQAFRRGFELNPAYEYAGYHIFDMQLADEDFTGAAETLAILRRHTEGPFVVAREIELAVKQGSQPTACEHLAALCVTPCESSTPLSMAVQAFTDAKWQPQALQVLNQALDDPQSHPDVCGHWGWLNGKGQYDCGPRLRELAERGKAAQGAFQAYFDALFAEHSDRAALRFLTENRGWLRERTFTWGLGGWALTHLREFKQAAEWLADWRQRPDAEPWMLVNAAEGLRFLRRDAEAAEVSHYALTLPPAHGQHLHHLWLAADAVCQRQLEQAQQHLPEVRTRDLDEDYEFLATVVEGVVEMATAPRAQLRLVFRKVRQRVDKSRAGYTGYVKEPARQRVYRRCLIELARYRGGLAAWLWACYRWLNS